MQSMNPFISNELFSWMSIWSHELLVSDSGGQEEEKEEKERGRGISVGSTILSSGPPCLILLLE